MRVAKLSDVKNGLSRYVEQVRNGERVRILVRGVAAADLVPVTAVNRGAGAGGWPVDELDELERSGVIRRGVPLSPAASKELDRPGPRVKGGRAVEALLAERRAKR